MLYGAETSVPAVVAAKTRAVNEAVEKAWDEAPNCALRRANYLIPNCNSGQRAIYNAVKDSRARLPAWVRQGFEVVRGQRDYDSWARFGDTLASTASYAAGLAYEASPTGIIGQTFTSTAEKTKEEAKSVWDALPAPADLKRYGIYALVGLGLIAGIQALDLVGRVVPRRRNG